MMNECKCNINVYTHHPLKEQAVHVLDISKIIVSPLLKEHKRTFTSSLIKIPDKAELFYHLLFLVINKSY